MAGYKINDIEWTLRSGAFRLVRMDPDGMELSTPSGQALILTMDEWRGLQNGLARILDPPKNMPNESSNHGQGWSAESEDRLKSRFNEGADFAALAQEFGRTPGGIRSRLRRLGLIE